jgi:DNA-binding MarR family transcriptional regulator
MIAPMAFEDRPSRLVGLTTYLISQTARVAKRELDQRLSARGLQLRHMLVMAALYDGEATQLGLGRRLGLDPSDITAIVDDLENARFATRRTDPADRRRKLVTLTARGGRELDTLEGIARDIEEMLLEPLGPEHRAHLHRALATALETSDNRAGDATR